MLTVRKQKSITAQNSCIQVSFSPIAKTSHNLHLLVLSEKQVGQNCSYWVKDRLDRIAHTEWKDRMDRTDSIEWEVKLDRIASTAWEDKLVLRF